ncbi:MAG: hypothetical protein QOI29_3160 [Mycobacterium sp.]|jgi:hypothetical protein|nr:hypothetical protein [Mycobacterium sp.]
MAVENVHERLREAREKHRVMVGNPLTETPAQNIDVAGVTVLGYDECQTVLTDPDRFSSSIYSTSWARSWAAPCSKGGRRTPREPGPGVAVVPGEVARAVAHRARRGRGARADRPVRPARIRRPGAGVHLCVPVQVIARLMGLPREDYEYFGEIFAFLLLILPAGVETTAFRSPAALPVEITAA